MLFSITFSGFTQENKKFSTAVNVSYIYFELNDDKYTVDFKNKFNYEINTKIHYDISSAFTLGVGLGYQNKDYYYSKEVPDFNENIKYEFYLKNLNFFFETSFRKIKISSFDIHINNAIIINQLSQHKVVTTHYSGSQESYDNIGFDSRTGMTYRLSFDLVKKMSKTSSIFLTPFWNYKFQFEDMSNSRLYSFNDTNISFGISLGFMFNF
jgi:hypothetical protein